MVVYNTTNISGEKAKEVLIKSSKVEIFKRFFLVAVLFVAGLGILIMGIIPKDPLYISFGAVFLAASVLYAVYNWIQLIKLPKRVIKKNQEVCEHGITYEYRFKEQSILVTCKEEGKTTKIDYKYQDIKSVKKFEEYYEIFLVNRNIFYVDVKGFSEPKMMEFFEKNFTMNKKKIKNKIKNNNNNTKAE